MRYYEKIDGSKYRNIWVVGDLHGCYTNLMKTGDDRIRHQKKTCLSRLAIWLIGAENVECPELITFPVQSCTWKP